MKKKKYKIKKITFIIITLILIILGTIIFTIIKNNSKVKVKLKNNLNVEINEKLTNISLIEKVNNGNLVTKEETVDTSKLGKKEITIELKNKSGKIQNYKYTINIVDTTKPVITFNKEIELTEGSNIDLLEGVSATDNSLEKIEVNIEGDYDLNKAGEYKIYFIAKDSSNNIAKEEVMVIVKEKPAISVNTNVSTDRKFTTSKGFKGEVKNGVTYIDGVLIANKTYSLPSTYGNGITPETNAAFSEMQKAAANEGIYFGIVSGFRSYSTQVATYNYWVSLDGVELADTYSARAGHSEHQSGLALDIGSIDDSFGESKEGIWLTNNASKYGFILRYPKDKSNETGYKYEPWHFRYVGKDLASKLYNNGDWITLETYFGITSEYSN